MGIPSRRARLGRCVAGIAAALAMASVTSPGWAATRAPVPIVRAGQYRLLTEPDDGMHLVDAFIAGARPGEAVDMTMYELGDPTIEKLLVTDAHHGVAVKVLLDRAYDGGSYNREAFRYLARHGVAVRWAPARYDTTHEKSIIVGDTALIATFNLTAEYYSSTRDFGVFDSNPADVAALEATFAADWSSRPTVPSNGADLVWSPGSAPALVALIDGAQHTLAVESEEMSDIRIVTALERAARRGVDVEVTMTASPHWTANLQALVAAGVHVHTYSDKAPLYIHAKVIVADAGGADEKVFIGSENFGAGSLNWNREVGLVLGVGAQPIVAVASSVLTLDFAGAPAFS